MKEINLLVASVLYAINCFSQTPQLVKDINPGKNGVFSCESIALKNKMIFNLSSSTPANVNNLNELWITDGSNTGTFMLHRYMANTPVYGFTKMDDKVYFIASDSIHGNELWVTDGTSSGTEMVKDINPTTYYGGLPFDYHAKYLQALNHKLFFPANDGVHGTELWTSDGTASGTVMVKDINPTGSSILTDPTLYLYNTNAVANNKYFFTATDSTHGYELWVSDGTTPGTYMVKDINTDTDNNAYPCQFIVYNNYILFTANYGTYNFGFYKSDGTATGTTKLYDQIENYADYALMDTELIFWVYNWQPGSYFSLWKTNGTAAGTALIRDSLNCLLYYTGYDQEPITGLTIMGNRAYFLGEFGLWTSDGTKAQTKLLYTPSSFSAGAGQLTEANGLLYFRAYSTASGKLNAELFRSNGTNTGTSMLNGPIDNAKVSYGPLVSRSPITQVGNTLLFLNDYDTSVGTELYKLDIPAAVLVLNKTVNEVKIWPNPASSSVQITVNNLPTGQAGVQSTVNSIVVLNTIGQVVFKGSFNDKAKMQIDVSRWNAGVYFVQVDGLYAGKFVKE